MSKSADRSCLVTHGRHLWASTLGHVAAHPMAMLAKLWKLWFAVQLLWRYYNSCNCWSKMLWLCILTRRSVMCTDVTRWCCTLLGAQLPLQVVLQSPRTLVKEFVACIGFTLSATNSVLMLSECAHTQNASCPVDTAVKCDAAAKLMINRMQHCTRESCIMGLRQLTVVGFDTVMSQKTKSMATALLPSALVFLAQLYISQLNALD